MEKAKLYCKAIPRNYGKSRVIVQDLNGREITGIMPLEDNQIDVEVLEDRGNKAFVLLPKEFSRDTAWINSKLLN